MLRFLCLLSSLLHLSSARLPSYSLKALHYAAAAYCSPNLIENWSCHFCKKERNFELGGVVVDDELSAFTGYDRSSKMIVLSFRGTSNLNNAARDANIIRVNAPGIKHGRLHKGFWNAYRDVMDPYLKEEFRKMMKKYPSRPILVVGHSLGGAMANIAALDIKENMSRYFDWFTSGDKRRRVYVRTFGAPRFCNYEVAKVFDRKLKSRSARFSNVDDFICRVPSWWVGFRHVGTQYFCDDDCDMGKDVQKCDSGRNGVEPSGCNIKINYPRYEDHLTYLGVFMSCSTIEKGDAPAGPMQLPQEPSNPVDPVGPVDPVRPVKPVQPIQPIEPIQPLHLSPGLWALILGALVITNIVASVLYYRSVTANRELQEMLVKY